MAQTITVNTVNTLHNVDGTLYLDATDDAKDNGLTLGKDDYRIEYGVDGSKIYVIHSLNPIIMGPNDKLIVGATTFSSDDYVIATVSEEGLILNIDAETAADMMAIMGLFIKILQARRDGAKVVRDAQLSSQVEIIVGQADKMKSIADEKRTKAFLDGGLTMASGVVEGGAAVKAAHSTFKGSHLQMKNNLARKEIEASTKTYDNDVKNIEQTYKNSVKANNRTYTDTRKDLHQQQVNGQQPIHAEEIRSRKALKVRDDKNMDAKDVRDNGLNKAGIIREKVKPLEDALPENERKVANRMAHGTQFSDMGRGAGRIGGGITTVASAEREHEAALLEAAVKEDEAYVLLHGAATQESYATFEQMLADIKAVLASAKDVAAAYHESIKQMGDRIV